MRALKRLLVRESGTASGASPCCFAREGWLVNHKRVRRIYREENLSIRTKTPKRRRAAAIREERVVPTAPNQTWAMDFMHDLLADGTKIRLLTIVDSFSRESLALEVGTGFKAAEVVEVLRRLVAGARSTTTHLV